MTALDSKAWRPALLGLCLLGGAGCDSAPGAPTGSVELLASFAGHPDDVAHVAIEILTPKLESLRPRLTSDLLRVDGRWTGVISGIPAQPVVFSAVATDAAGQPLYREQTLVLVEDKRTNLVAMTLRPAQAAAGPIIRVATATANQVEFGQTVSLAVSATDGDPTQVLGVRLSWSASAGSFVGPTNQPTATWRAPPGPAGLIATLRVTATDLLGLRDTKTVDVVVVAHATASGAVVELNSWPHVDVIHTDALVLPAGGLAHLHGAGFDPDGDALSYTWALDGCQGSFPNGSSANDVDLRFAVQPVQQTCTVRLLASDGRGGTGEGSLTLTVGPAAATSPPRIDLQLISDARIFDGSTARLTLAAHDPDDPQAPLNFSWTAHNGSISAVSADPTVGSASFQSIPCSGDAWATAQVQNARGGPVTTVHFPLINCAPSCKELKLKNGLLGDGVQTIDPDGTADGTNPPLQVYCDMTTDGGGWTFFAHHDATSSGLRWFDAPLGSYLTSRADGPPYSLGTLPLFGASEMMVALGAASPSQALAGEGLVLLTHASNEPNFTRGPLPCRTGVSFGYRTKLNLPYTSSSNWRCDAATWMAQDQGGADLLGFGGPGVFAGTSVGGTASWGHSAWIYVR